MNQPSNEEITSVFRDNGVTFAEEILKEKNDNG
jgi:hypothetical protein